MFSEDKESDWNGLIEDIAGLPDFPPDYSPNVIEMFDQQGLLAGMVSGQIVYECQRESSQPSEYVAWYFDGQLALFCVKGNILINRMNLMVIGASIVDSWEG